MASQSSFEEVATPVEAPSTPQPNDLDLPAKQDLPQAASPATSMVAAGPSSALHSSSLTPPPSSQAPPFRRAETPLHSPEPSILSSPPLTGVNGIKREESTVSTQFIPPTTAQLESASTEELRRILRSLVSENFKLNANAREARMSAAHYQLQYNLLTIESEEAAKRMEVEHDLTKREVLALQQNGRDPASNDYISKLKEYCKTLEKDNQAAMQRLRKAKRVIQMKDDQLQDVAEENARLRERIRQNREHINVLRSPGGPLHIPTPKTAPSTPQQYRGTPKQTPRSNRQAPGSARPFEALLLADAVLSQENNSAPSTPTLSRRLDPRTPTRHQRGVQSLSSLPTTPGSVRPLTSNSTLLPSAQISPEVHHQGWDAISRSRDQRRRKSRDSTISAPDAEEIARAATSFREESQEIQESQASQSAIEMPRADPRESFEVAASRNTTPNPGEKYASHQGKIYGSVTKPAIIDKRKRAEEDYSLHQSPKKLRELAGEAVGLGIGLD